MSSLTADVRPHCLAGTPSSLWDDKLSVGRAGRTALANRTCSSEPQRQNDGTEPLPVPSPSLAVMHSLAPGDWRGARRTK